ncbi:MAG TPA: MFS transporter [Aliidongia sp.]|uniref:MFS transporter n=1 Tax=Aliidongia sp. TaxID=1914230 RepID=UPI002DDD7EE7|nr:MFS transporter [Aliidongia sp.]HEV2678696.1 MFS transporter [Aliidongia sp.]
MTQTNETDIPEEGLPMPQRHLALAAVLAAMVLVVLDGAIANVALPTIAGALQVSPGASVWVVTGYQLALVIAILPCAALGESLGYRRVFVGGALVFTGASLLCAVSPSLPWLVAARFLQGLGGACLMALGVALLRFTYPHRRLGAVIGWNSLVIALSAAIGPTVGATIISLSSWPWLFAVNLPVGAVVLLMSRALPKPPGSARKLDLISIVLNAATFGSLVLAAEFMVAQPWLGGPLLAVAAVCLAALIRREMPRQAPLIPLDLLRDGSFRISVIASVLCFAGQMASYIALPFYLQHGLGQDAFTTGLYMTPWPLTVAFAGPISGRLADRFATSWLCAAGGTCLALGLVLACLWPLSGNLLPIVPITMLSGLGFGFFQVPNNRNMFISAPRARSGAAGGMQGTARLVGQTMGAVIMTLLFSLAPVDAAPRIGLAVAAVFALAGGLVSVLRVGRTFGN